MYTLMDLKQGYVICYFYGYIEIIFTILQKTVFTISLNRNPWIHSFRLRNGIKSLPKNNLIYILRKNIRKNITIKDKNTDTVHRCRKRDTSTENKGYNENKSQIKF